MQATGVTSQPGNRIGVDYSVWSIARRFFLPNIVGNVFHRGEHEVLGKRRVPTVGKP